MANSNSPSSIVNKFLERYFPDADIGFNQSKAQYEIRCSDCKALTPIPESCILYYQDSGDLFNRLSNNYHNNHYSHCVRYQPSYKDYTTSVTIPVTSVLSTSGTTTISGTSVGITYPTTTAGSTAVYWSNQYQQSTPTTEQEIRELRNYVKQVEYDAHFSKQEIVRLQEAIRAQGLLLKELTECIKKLQKMHSAGISKPADDIFNTMSQFMA